MSFIDSIANLVKNIVSPPPVSKPLDFVQKLDTSNWKPSPELVQGINTSGQATYGQPSTISGGQSNLSIAGAKTPIEVAGQNDPALQQMLSQVVANQGTPPPPLIPGTIQWDQQMGGDVYKGGFMWSSQEDYEKDASKARSMGYSSPEAMRAAEQQYTARHNDLLQNTSSFLSNLSGLFTKPAYAADIGTPTPVPTPNYFSSTTLNNVADRGRQGVMDLLNSISQGITQSNPYKMASGALGLAGTIQGLPEFGISEWLYNKGKTTPSKTSWETSLTNGGGSWGSEYTGAAQKNLINTLQTSGNNLKQSYLDAGDTSGLDEEAFALLQNPEEINQQLDQIWGNQEMSYEDKMAAEEAKLTEIYTKQYDALEAQIKSQDPIVRRQAQDQLNKLKSDWETYQNQYKNIVQENKELAGESTRGTWLNKREAEKKLRNVYGSIGSGESSQFLEKLQGLENTAGDYVNKLNTTLQKVLGDLGTQFTSAQKDYGTATTGVNNWLNDALNEIANKIQLNEASKYTDIQNALMTRGQDYTDIENLKNQYKSQALLNQQNAYNSLGQLALGNTYNQQIAAMQNPTANMSKYIPNVLDQELKSIMSKGSNISDFDQQTLQNAIMAYPNFKDVINQIWRGEIGLDEYLNSGYIPS